jgi:hypothetical protein
MSAADSERREKALPPSVLLGSFRFSLTTPPSLPVFPSERTTAGLGGMSQRCHQWTTALLFVISPLYNL